MDGYRNNMTLSNRDVLSVLLSSDSVPRGSALSRAERVFPVMQMRLSADEMAMMIDLVSDGRSGTPGLDLEMFLRIAETTQWY
jgi:hypothetical protein